MIKIRSVILDFGGVISQPQKKNFVEKAHKILKQNPSNLMKVCGNYRENFDNGRDTGEEYWSNILRHYGYPLNKSDIEALIVEDINSWIEINHEMLEFIVYVRKRIYNLSLISNMPFDTLDYVKTHFQWLDYFDVLTFSCEVGVNKPDSVIYDYCLGKIGVPSHECLFVDDSIANVDGAKRAGLNAVHFKSYSQFAEELEGKYRLYDV